jgi:hypothetical protein
MIATDVRSESAYATLSAPDERGRKETGNSRCVRSVRGVSSQELPFFPTSLNGEEDQRHRSDSEHQHTARANNDPEHDRQHSCVDRMTDESIEASCGELPSFCWYRCRCQSGAKTSRSNHGEQGAEQRDRQTQAFDPTWCRPRRSSRQQHKRDEQDHLRGDEQPAKPTRVHDKVYGYEPQRLALSADVSVTTK